MADVKALVAELRGIEKKTPELNEAQAYFRDHLETGRMSSEAFVCAVSVINHSRQILGFNATLLDHIESLEADKERLTKALGQACELGGFKIGTCPENKAWIEHDACGDWLENKPELAQWLKENQ